MNSDGMVFGHAFRAQLGIRNSKACERHSFAMRSLHRMKFESRTTVLD
jgi:hypothetical protein